MRRVGWAVGAVALVLPSFAIAQSAMEQGLALYRQGRFEEALAKFQEDLVYQPTNTLLRRHAANAACGTGSARFTGRDLETAKKMADLAIDYDEPNPCGHLLRAQVHYDRDERE